MHETIIVGAGAAGLAAARRLRDAGRPALVVEARGRIGGRIHTDRSHGPAELGAEFIHGDRAATWEIVAAAGLRTAPWRGPRRFGRAGRLFPADDPLGPRAAALYAAAADHRGPDLSTAALLRQRAAPDDPALAIALQWLANVEGADPERLSAAALTREHQTSSNGDDNFHILDGYDRVVAALADGLAIQLDSPVERVAWGADGVALTMAGGAELRARRAILSVPLGVLQAGRPAFAPELPAAKRRAIASIAMGQVTKLLLWFERPLWPALSALSTDGAVATWWPVESAATPTLMGYTGGPAALRLAAMGEAAAIATALGELSVLFATDAAAACLGGRMADWSADPWSLGAYSYSPLGMGDARAELGRPLDRLHFAGEATVTGGHLATVHGAIESGRRAANQVLASGE